MSLSISPSSLQESLFCTICTYEPLEVFKYLEKLHSLNQLIKGELLKASGKALQTKLSIFDQKQIIKISLIFIEGESTNLFLYDNLLNNFKDHLNKATCDEYIQICSLLRFLEIAKSKQPPNQIVVSFLENLKRLLSGHLKNNNTLIDALCSKLNSDQVETAVCADILEMVIDVGIIHEKTIACKKAFEKIKARNIEYCNRTLTSNFNLLHFYFQYLAKKKLGQKKNFYNQDNFYLTLSSKIQCSVNDLALSQIDSMTCSMVKARVRDPSVLRTFARKIFKLASYFKIDDYKIIVRILDNYAKLNIQNPLLFEVFYNYFITKNIKPDAVDPLTLLHTTALFRINGSSKVKTLTLSKRLSPYVVLPKNNSDLLKLEIMKLFIDRMFPKISILMPKSYEKAKQLKGMISPVQQKVSDFLTTCGLDNECEAFIDDYPYPLDIVLRKKWVIVEVDGPHHKDISGKVWLGNDVLKNFLLNKKWKLIRIDANAITKSTQSSLNKLKTAIESM